MFNYKEIPAIFKNLIGWQDHYDTGVIPALSVDLTSSQSGQYYQQFHPALNLEVIKSSLPDNRTLENYLNDRRSAASIQMTNDIVIKRGYDKYATKTLANDVIIDRYGWSKDTILNVGRFVGFAIKPKLSIGLASVIKAIGFQQTASQNVTFYLYHSSKHLPVETFTISSSGSNDFTWTNKELRLYAEDQNNTGGLWIVGYYQDDLDGQAINYSKLDWKNGPCGSCDGGQRLESFRNLRKYMSIEPIYVAGANLPELIDDVRPMFDLNDMFYDLNTNHGVNFRISAECDLTNFVRDHKMAMTQLLGLKTAIMILEDIKHSLQINYIEEEMKAMIIRDLEGDKETNGLTMYDKYNMAMEQVNFDHSKKSAYCLPCESTKGAIYGVA